MNESELLPKFHQHLLILQQAGFDVASDLLRDFAVPKSGPASPECLGLMQYRLSQLEAIVREKAAAEGLNVQSTILPLDGVQAAYLYAFSQWRDGDQQLSSLEPLIVKHQSLDMSRQGLQQLRLKLFCYLVFGAVALFSVTVVARPAIKNLVDQLRVEPPWLLNSLLSPAPMMVLSVFLLTLAVLLLAGRWIGSSNFSSSLGHQKDLATFELSGQPVPPSSPVAPPLPKQDSRQPSVKAWVNDSHCSEKEILARRQFAKNFYAWLNQYQSYRQRRLVPQRLSLVVGGALTLAIGLLLFAPMVQLLMLVINTAGLRR